MWGGTGDAFVAEPGTAGGSPEAAPPARPALDLSLSGVAAAERRLGGWLRRHGLACEVGAALVAGVATALALSSQATVALVSLGFWAVSAYHRGAAVTSPVSRQLRALANSALVPIAAAAGAVAFLSKSPVVLSRVFTMVAVASVTAALCRVFRWRLQSPVRVVLVGDRVSIAQNAVRWSRQQHLRLAGAMLMEPDLSEDEVPREVFGVPVVAGIERARDLVAGWKADLVVVAPGPGFTATDMRRLSWTLERSRATIGVLGVLDSVAPFRVIPGALGGATVMGVRPPRPSGFVRLVKAAADRAAAVVLLVLFAPVLLAMALAVKLDSPGPAFFVQSRIGQHGRPFRVFKMRTMVTDAEERKAELSEVNEGGEVLFKMKRDPRVTRVGSLLRKSSLDELPQLLNVVRGEMSLVGPRPFLASETVNMDRQALRRLAVKPGITGLWQVSGRSDLEWEEASALDGYYADNWSLTGDVVIGLRTVKAVMGADGAY
jgi:exopolysaccharide biosynthesis polyprenyl glycosylphosphotransferase